MDIPTVDTLEKKLEELSLDQPKPTPKNKELYKKFSTGILFQRILLKSGSVKEEEYKMMGVYSTGRKNYSNDS